MEAVVKTIFTYWWNETKGFKNESAVVPFDDNSLNKHELFH